jgi:hypothetical protein
MTHWFVLWHSKEKGFPFVILFLSGTDSYGKLDSEVMNASEMKSQR